MSQQINLYSPIFRKQPKVFSANTMLQGVALIVVVVTVFYYVLSLQTSLLEIRAADSSRQLKSELERLKAYGVTESAGDRAKSLAERRKMLEAALAAQKQAYEALASGGGGRSEGYAGVLGALSRVSVEGVWLTRIQIAEGSAELSLAGKATRPELVPAYLERLRAEPTLRSQLFDRFEVVRPAPAAPAPGAPVVALPVEFMLVSGDGGRAK